MFILEQAFRCNAIRMEPRVLRLTFARNLLVILVINAVRPQWKKRRCPWQKKNQLLPLISNTSNCIHRINCRWKHLCGRTQSQLIRIWSLPQKLVSICTWNFSLKLCIFSIKILIFCLNKKSKTNIWFSVSWKLTSWFSNKLADF